MSLWEWFSDQISSVTTRPTTVSIPKANDLIVDASGTMGAATGVPLIAEEHYLRLWVREMCLRNDRSWFTSRYPTVHSVVSLQYGDQTLELANIVGTSKLKLNPADLRRSVSTNYPMTALLPFRGGTVELDCGLASIKNDDLVKDFAGVVSDFAGKLTAPQLSSVIALASTVAGGIQQVLTGGDAAPKLFYHSTFTGQNPATPLTSGFIFLSAAPENSIQPNQLWMTKEGIRKGASKGALQVLEVDDYLVVQIEAATTRDDWMQLSAISNPFQIAVDAKLAGDGEKAKVLLAQARIAAYKSTDLTMFDRKRVLAAMVKYYNEVDSEVAGLEGVRSGALTIAVNNVSMDEVRNLNLPSERDLVTA